MTSQLFVGIDSGGTRTNVEIFAAGGSGRREKYESSDVLSGSLTPTQYAPVLRRILARVENYWQQEAISSMPVYLFIGAAGFASSTRDHFAEALEDALPSLLNGSITVAGVVNDATALLLGHKADGVVIAGTGSTVLVRDGNEKLHVAGGHDWVAGDYGSGFWIGLRGIRQACRDFEAGLETVLLQRLKEVYAVRAHDDRALLAKLRDLSVSDENTKAEVARFAAAVAQAAERGDVAAQNIIKAEAEDLADQTASALRRRVDRAKLASNFSMIQCGGVLANDFYRAAFDAQVQMRLLGADGAPSTINWKQVPTGGEAVMSLARRLEGDHTDLLRLDRTFAPVVVYF